MLESLAAFLVLGRHHAAKSRAESLAWPGRLAPSGPDASDAQVKREWHRSPLKFHAPRAKPRAEKEMGLAETTEI